MERQISAASTVSRWSAGTSAPKHSRRGSRKTTAVGAADRTPREPATPGFHDFAWLLERVADFGTEAPPSSVTTWRVKERPPPPLQLLIPECAAFDGNSGCYPWVLFFSDAGGFLRGARRALHEDPRTLFQTLDKIARQRYQTAWEYAAKAAAALDSSAVNSLGGTAEKRTSFKVGTLATQQADSHQNTQEGVAGVRRTVTIPTRDATGTLSASSSPVASPRSAADTAGGKKSWAGRVPDVGKRRRRSAEKNADAAEYSRVAWRLLGKGGQDVPILDADAEAAFRNVREKDSRRTLPGARLLQACFWPARERPSEAHSFIGMGCLAFSYRYDAMKPAADVRLNLPVRSEQMTRAQIMDRVADKNLVSSLPIILSQHLAYRCRLELVSGEFDFIRDHLNQVWLVDARNLRIIASTAHKKQTGAEGASANQGDGTKKLVYRYLSEEALSNLPLSKKEGETCGKMCEMMATYYQDVKDAHGVDSYLKRSRQGEDICVPILEGMDQTKLVRTFGAIARTGKEAANDAGDVNHAELITRKPGDGGQPVRPHSTCSFRRGRLVPASTQRESSAKVVPRAPKTPAPATPRPLSRSAVAAKREDALNRGAHPLWPTVPWTAAPEHKIDISIHVDSTLCVERTAQRRGHRPKKSMMSSRVVTVAGNETAGAPNAANQIDLTLSEEAEKLVSRTGLGLRPRGETLDEQATFAQDAPGMGLRGARATDKAGIKLVQVPAGAAAKVVAAKYGIDIKSKGYEGKTLGSSRASSKAQVRQETPRSATPHVENPRLRSQSWPKELGRGQRRSDFTCEIEDTKPSYTYVE